MQTINKNSEEYQIAKKQLGEIKGFYIHLFIYLIVNIGIIITNFKYNESIFDSIINWSTLGTAVFWGIGLVSHWSRVFGRSIFFSKNWEERKIQELINKNKKTNWE